MAIDTYRNEVTRVLSKPFETTTAANQQVIAAITGKKIRVMGVLAQSNTAVVGGFNFIDGSGGTELMAGVFVPVGPGVGGTFLLPLNDNGYFETSAGVGLYLNGATDVVKLTVFYIAYVP